VLVRQVAGATTTDYTQDMAAPLSAVYDIDRLIIARFPEAAASLSLASKAAAVPSTPAASRGRPQRRLVARLVGAGVGGVGAGFADARRSSARTCSSSSCTCRSSSPIASLALMRSSF
jgi:hypothetical protein